MSAEYQFQRMLAVGRSVWTAAALRTDQSWVRQFATAELDELRDATVEASAQRGQSRQTERVDVPLPILSSMAQQIRQELDAGRGLFLLRGLNVQDYSLDQLVMLYSGLAIQLGGALVPQNLTGDLVRFVTDRSEVQLNDDQARGHCGRAEMLPHSDSSEIIGLLCVRSAKQGGTTSVCSSASVYNEITRRNPAHLVPLQEGFYFDMAGKTESGVSQCRLPVFSCEGGRVACQYNRIRIETGMRKAGVPLSPAETAALECMSSLARHPVFAFRFELWPGDVLFLDNSRVLHARDAYEDWGEPDRKRLLLRLWLTR